MKRILCLVLCVLFLPGCATVFKGYYSKVELVNPPDSLRVYTSDGVEVPVEKTAFRVQLRSNPDVWGDRPGTVIQLRSSADPILTLRTPTQEKKIQAYGKIGAGWLILDCVCGFLPAAVDALTGNWNSYEAIDAAIK